MSFIQSSRGRDSRPLAVGALAKNESAKSAPPEPQYQLAFIQPVMGKILALFFLSVLVASANVCTPINVPVNGPFPAVVNGIDAVDWGIARIQWTSDATSAVPATNQQILYATAAEWSAKPNTYPHTG